jgi:hypothetical protein
MANKKISELQSRTPALSDLMLVGDPSSGYSYKCTVTALATIIETDIADGYVTIGTTQTISGAKTFSNNLTLTSVVNTPTDPDKFLTLNASNVVTYRTGAEVLSDIGGVGGSGTTNYLPKFSATTTLANSQIFDNGTNVGIGVGSSIIAGYLLTIGGKVKIYNQIDLDNPTTNTCNAINIQKGTSISHRGVGYIQIASFNTNRLSLFFNDNNNYQADFDGSNLTTGQRYILPNATGTLALTSDLSSYVPTSRILTINGTSYDLSANRTWSVGTVTSVAALTLGTTGTDLSSSVANGTTTPVITLNIPTASATNRGALSSTDWSTFNNKQSTITLTTTGSSGSATFVSNTLNVPTYTLAGLGGISGTGTTNYIPKFTSSSAIGNSSLYQSDTRSVSINTTIGVNDDGNLVVAGSDGTGQGAANTVAQINIWETTSANKSGLWFGSMTNQNTGVIGSRTASGNIAFQTYNSGWGERMRITSSGLVGIGTSAPTELLELSTATDPKIRFVDVGNLDAKVGIVGSTALGFEVNGSERLRISSTGNVSIGNTNNTYKLDVTGSARTQQTSAGSEVSGLIIQNVGNTPSTAVSLNFAPHENASSPTTLAKISAIRTATNNAPTDLAFYTFNSSLSERMRLDASGNLGINTSSPARKLDVNGTGRFTSDLTISNSSRLFLNGTTGQDWALRTNTSTGNFEIVDWTTEVARITMSAFGNLGLGVSPSAWARKAIQIGDAAQGYVVSNTRTGFAVNMYYDGNNKYIENNYAALYAQDGTSGQHQWFIAPSGSANGTISFTQAMTLDASGRLGIGTTSPTYPLEVRGNILVGDNTTNTMRFGSYASESFIYSSSAIPLTFYTNASERMRITSGGELLINTTSDAGDYKLQVNGNGYVSGNIRVAQSVNNNYISFDHAGTNTWYQRITTDNTSTFLLKNDLGGGSGTTVFKVSEAGNAEFPSGSIKTAAPSGGTAKPWKLGEAGVTLGGSNTSGVRVEIDGTVYYLVTGYLP